MRQVWEIGYLSFYEAGMGNRMALRLRERTLMRQVWEIGSLSSHEAGMGSRMSLPLRDKYMK